MGNRIRVWSGRGLFAVGVGLLTYWAGVAIDARAIQHRLALRLERIAGTEGTPPHLEVARATRREALSSGLVGRLEIPRLGISAMILEGAEDRALGRGIGHVPSTAFPGEPGNVGLAAHRDTYFRPLKDVSRGDLVHVSTADGSFTYEVEWMRIVEPDRVDLLDDTGRPALTLVTCHPFDWIGPAPMRFVVRARPAGQRVAPGPEPPPAASPAVATAAESGIAPALLPVRAVPVLEADADLLDSLGVAPGPEPPPE